MQNLVSEAANGCLFSAWIHFKLGKTLTSKAVQAEDSYTGNRGWGGDGASVETIISRRLVL